MISEGVRRYYSNPENRIEASRRMKGIRHSERMKLNMSIAMKGKYLGRKLPEETKLKISLATKGRKFGVHTRESYQRAGLAHRGKKPPEYGLAVSKAMQSIRGKLSAIKLRQWKDPGYVAMQMRARGCRPNKAELRLQDILDKHFPKEWKYVGDGQLIIGGRCPDYANINGKKDLIELYGAHWHNPEQEQPRIEHFREYGYRCIIIWEYELKDEELLLKKISSWVEEEV